MKLDEPLLSSESVEALYHCAYTSYKQGKFGDAENLFGFLTTVDTKARKHWMGLGAARQRQKKYEEAIEAYELAAALDAGDPHVHIYAADCYIGLGKVENALFALDCAERAAKQQKPSNNNILAHVSLMRQAWKGKR